VTEYKALFAIRLIPRWNFHKYLIGRSGYITDVFPETVEPSDTRVKTAIARTLAET
jgi:glutathione peroxidase